MVDDVLAVQKCSKKSVEINAVTNAFIELKKLTLSQKKCSKIHIGKENSACPQLKVHEENMKESKQEKYLGDQLHSSGKIKATIDDRTAKGYGIVSDILAILDEIPLGTYRLDIGLKLRQAKLISGILFNSEGWHGVKDDDVRMLEKVDEALLRALIKGHSKVPIEFLYLETGCVPIRHIISSRRMLYLQTLLLRDDEEVTKRVLREQQQHPTPGDFTLLVKDDCRKMKIIYNENSIISAGIGFKKQVKDTIRNIAFDELLDMQKQHSKILAIDYEKFEAQPYLKSSMFTNDDVSLLAASAPVEDTQQHLLACSKLHSVHTNTVANKRIEHNDIYGDTASQKAVVSLFHKLIELRNKLLEQ